MPKSENMSSLWSVASSVDLFVVKPRKPKTKINFSHRNQDNNDNCVQKGKGNYSLTNNEGYGC